MKDLDNSLKNLYNEDDIKIPDSLREKVNKIYEDIESKGKKNARNNVLKVAGLFIALLIGINFVKPSLAEELPIVGPVLKVLNNKWGLGIKYTENGLSVKEEFHTENHTINIEAVDFDGEYLLVVYKIQSKIKLNKPTIYGFTIEIRGEDFTVEERMGLDTGGPDEDGIYYGYSVRQLNFEKGMDKKEELTVYISPKKINYTKDNEEVREEINDSREIKLTIKNKNYR
ncbi:DUF4179 domain-containing protein [Clostridium sp. AL.422]|uniref:DUF4179 domain-containing protein n=1 Tax=Clostridium TaxID=1485 RepID=UPI00293DEB88|nr:MULTISPECIES: DUF4179 domain-containing protein [unclassified Clostridium]MDV4149853.1 DUF4179 domain-containing protein [Clostridium sp. AL.422]